jgi:hypothetical protein
MSHEAYDGLVKLLFETLDSLEARLSQQRYLCGDVETEADPRISAPTRWPVSLPAHLCGSNVAPTILIVTVVELFIQGPLGHSTLCRNTYFHIPLVVR